MATSRLGLAGAWGLLKTIRFNQDRSCFICSFEDGLRIYNVDPIRELAHLRQSDVGSVAFAEMLFRTNMIAIVSGGQRPLFAENTVMLFDEKKAKFVLEFTVPSPVLAVRMKRNKLITVCRDQIHVFSFPNNCKKLFSLTTRDNPRGLCEISPLRLKQGADEVMIFPGFKTGSIQIVNIATTEEKSSSAPITINAHRNKLSCIAINQQGSMIASASSKGTLIRIWDVVRRCMLVELRRGSDTANVYCINFSLGDDWLCCSSDKGTVHIFALQDYTLNRRSALASIGLPGAYAGSQWSLASFTVPQEVACMCAFARNTTGNGDSGSKDKSAASSVAATIYAVCLDGSFHKYHFSADGVCNQVAYDVFTDLCEDCEWIDMAKT